MAVKRYNGTSWVTEAGATPPTTATGFRNILINGDFRIWQRGTSGGHSGGSVYVDMWREYTDVGSATQSRDTTVTVPGIANQSYKFTVGGSATNFNLWQIVESANCGHLAGQTVTFSFYASVSSARNLNVVLASSTTTDALWTGSWTNFSSTAIALTTSMTRYTVTTTVPSNMKTLQVSFGSGGTLLAAGSSVNITGAQLEVGSIATPFEQRPIGTELALCQRYFHWNGGTNDAAFINVNSDNIIGFYPHPVQMRIAPIITLYNGTTANQVAPVGAAVRTANSIINTSPRGFALINNTGVGTGVGGALFNVMASAEL